ncbi:MAG TPA: DUF2971 domain-containing protein [Candidatus Hydrogenedentes bacterium]|nr:DUF2971 domain-containing protein [Candidatus Hydrogenedentota bacterium]
MYPYQPFDLIKSASHTNELQSAVQEFENTLWQQKHELNVPLFHYTSLEPVMGILKERCLRLSDITSFNDPYEQKYGISVISAAIDNAVENEIDDDISNFLKGIPKQLKIHENIYHIFVACFCEDGNLLSQWREYTNKGGGYSLGFEFTETTHMTLRPTSLKMKFRPRLRKVIYDPAEQKECIDAFLRLVIDAVRTAYSRKRPTGRFEAYLKPTEVLNPLMDLVTCFKHHAYKEEKEWRIVYFKRRNGGDDKFVEFIVDKDTLKPYLPGFLFENLQDGIYFPLKKIHFGPLLDPIHAKTSMELLLLKNATENHPIKLSPIPVRGPDFVTR